MGWIGKVIGGVIGLLVADAPGAVLGAILGHGLDTSRRGFGRHAFLSKDQRERAQASFRAATFSTMGHVAKADGRVSKAEIAMAEAAMAQMRFTAEQRRIAIAAFQRGKAPEFSLPEALASLRRDCREHSGLLAMFLQFQIRSAYADGEPSAPQRQLLEQVRRALGISEEHFRQLESLTRGQQSPPSGDPRKRARSESGTRANNQRSSELTLAQAYAVLGVKPNDSDAVIQRAYRRLRSQHHPDKLVARGLPEEMLRLATEKTQQIRRAYERIQRARTT